MEDRQSQLKGFWVCWWKASQSWKMKKEDAWRELYHLEWETQHSTRASVQHKFHFKLFQILFSPTSSMVMLPPLVFLKLEGYFRHLPVFFSFYSLTPPLPPSIFYNIVLWKQIFGNYCRTTWTVDKKNWRSEQSYENYFLKEKETIFRRHKKEGF